MKILMIIQICNDSSAVWVVFQIPNQPVNLVKVSFFVFVLILYGQKIRPKWSDDTPAYTLKCFGVLNEYDLQKEFPIATLRPTAFKSGLKEILWIYQDSFNTPKHFNV